MKYTTQTLAALLNGREIGSEISSLESGDARQSGLVVIYGASDDLCEIDGAIIEELNGDCEMGFHSKGAFTLDDEHDCNCDHCGFKSMAAKVAKVTSVWCAPDSPAWTYKTDLPHASFDIMEDGEVYCRGLVIDTKDLPVL